MKNTGDSNNPHQSDYNSAFARHNTGSTEGLCVPGNVTETHSSSGFRGAECLLILASEIYATYRTCDPSVAKAAAGFCVQGAYRLMDACVEVLEEGVDGLTPQQITDRIIAGIVERVEECAPPEFDDIVKAYLAQVQRAPQQSENEGNTE